MKHGGPLTLDLNSLQKAASSLAAVLANSDDTEFMNHLDEVARNAIKAGVIQHFEFTYELCWKFIKRWLETNISPTAADGVTRRELFRLAAENRLIDDVEQWMRYHEARNLTSYIYQPEIAERVYNTAHDFAATPRVCWLPWKPAMIDLSRDHLEKVRTILGKHVPRCEVRAFGSRVDGTPKNHSDLDLAVVCFGKLDDDKLRHLREAFEECDLPFRVDVLDWHATSPSFQKVVEKHYEVIQDACGDRAAGMRPSVPS